MAKDTGKKLADMLYGANPDQAAFGVYPQLKPKRSKQDPEAAKNVPVDLLRGAVSGVMGAPGDLESMIRLLPGLDESRTILPTSEDIEKRLPLKSDTPVSRATTGLGQLGGSFYTGPGSPFRLVGAIPGALKHGAEEFAKASAGSASHVIKPKGGNWIGGNLMGNIDENISRMKPYKKAGSPADWLQKDLAASEARLKMLEEDPYALPQMVEGQKQNIANIKQKIAVNDWVTNNLGKYAKNLMGTPEDPVRLMFDKRTAEIEAKYAKDMDRADRFAQRAMDEPDPRRQANFLREAERLKAEAATEREIAMDHITHMPGRLGEIDELADSSLKERRRAAGFPAEGMGQSEAARRWENLTDDAISSMRAGDIQASAGAMEESHAALQALRAKEAEIQQKFNEHVLSKGLSQKDLDAFNSMPMADKAAIIQDTEHQALQKNYNNKRLEVSSPEYEASQRNPWISKLDPETQVYSGHASDAGFDHVIDVLKQDVAEGRIRPEQLNKVSVEQAVARAAEYDREMAEKMAAAQAKSMEAFPVHKEYPEGYKWIEVTTPKSMKLPEGYSVKPDPITNRKTGVVDTNSYRLVDPEGKLVGWGKTEDEAISSGLGEKTLADALKNEGEQMGHCVGGYCPDVLEGRSRIFSLRGPKGESHVTVETSPGSIREYESAANALSDDDLYKHGQLAKKLMAENKNLNYGDADQMAYQQLFGPLPERIVQIKGKQNEAPVEKYLPYVQDFVKGGKWSEVGDLRNTGLLRYDTPEGAKYITKDEYSDMLLKELGAPPAEGMAHGGSIHISDNPDTMQLELAGGGLVKGLIKAVKGTQEVLPAAEREANLAKMIEQSAVKNRVYHGTESKDDYVRSSKGNDAIKSFAGRATWVAEEPYTAHGYSGKSGYVMPLHVQIKKPLTISHVDANDDASQIYGLAKSLGVDVDHLKSISEPERVWEVINHPYFIDAASNAGFDGISIKEGGLQTHSVFDPSKIKSAIGNRGTYDLTDPDINKAEGGEVHMAGGGALGALAKLARALPKTRQEIEAIAERMAPQVTGEYVRESAKSAKTVAGKTKKQFERERDLPVDIRATKEERVPQPVDIEKLKGEVMIGIPGDPTVTGKTLYSVGERKLGSPSPQHGGPQYGLYHDDDHFWASGLGAARRVQNLAREAAQQYDAPVAGNYIMMGPESINYAQHFADANLQAIDLSKMTKRQIEGFDKLIRQGSPASGPRPSFPGIEDKESAYLHMAMDPELRKHFNDLMQKNTVTEAFNLPSGHDIRYAITEPALRDLETGVTGYSLGRMRPDIPASELKLSEHPTYTHDIPGHFLGQSAYPMPYELSFPDTLRAIRENPKQAPHEFGSLKMVGPRQIIDQQLIDEIRAYEERMKQLTGKKKGGKVQKNEQAVQNPVHFTENPDAMRLAMTKRN